MSHDTLSALLRERRSEANLSQKALAEKISTKKNPNGVWATYIGQLEKGEKTPSAEVSVSLANALDIDPHLVLALAFLDRAETVEERHLAEVLLKIIREGPNLETSSSKRFSAGNIAETRYDDIARILQYAADTDDATWSNIRTIVEAIVASKKDSRTSELVGGLLSACTSTRFNQLLVIIEQSKTLDDSKWTALCNMASAFSTSDP